MVNGPRGECDPMHPAGSVLPGPLRSLIGTHRPVAGGPGIAHGCPALFANRRGGPPRGNDDARSPRRWMPHPAARRPSVGCAPAQGTDTHCGLFRTYQYPAGMARQGTPGLSRFHWSGVSRRSWFPHRHQPTNHRPPPLVRLRGTLRNKWIVTGSGRPQPSCRLDPLDPEGPQRRFDPLDPWGGTPLDPLDPRGWKEWVVTLG